MWWVFEYFDLEESHGISPHSVWEEGSLDDLVGVKIFSLDDAVGFGPEKLREGDNVVIVEGSRYPLILRQFEGCYELISLCHVFGVMNGEAWPKDSDQTLQEFIVI